MAYLTLAEFARRSIMPAADIDDLEAQAPGWIDTLLLSLSSLIDARLRKRYAVPFSEPVPEVVLSWLTRIATMRCYLRRGVDPRDPQFDAIKSDHDSAMLEIKEAADSKDGLWDLPPLQTTTTSGITSGAPLFYSESSPWDWTDRQAERVRG